MSHVGRFIRTLREDRLRITRQKFGERIGVTGQHVGQVERGLKGASDRLVQEIAEKFGTDPADRKALLLSLRDAGYRDRVPEGSDSLHAGDRYLSPSAPPPAFLELVQRTVITLGIPSEEIARAVGIPTGAWDLFIAGRFNLGRERVLNLAGYLGGEAEAYYLLLAGYLPLDLARILGEDTSRARTLMNLTDLAPDRIDDVFRTVKALTEPHAQSPK